jgi:uncharacterized protein YjdB
MPKTATIPLKGTVTLKATVYPADASNKTIVWSSSNTALATVNTTGLVTAKSLNGVVEVYAANAASGERGICIVTIGTGNPTPTDISEGYVDGIMVYPNPTNGELRIESGELRIESVEIFDVLGKKVFEQKENLTILRSYDLTVLTPGIYFIRITTENDVIMKKVVKQ